MTRQLQATHVMKVCDACSAGGSPKVEVPLDGTVYDLETGNVGFQTPALLTHTPSVCMRCGTSTSSIGTMSARIHAGGQMVPKEQPTAAGARLAQGQSASKEPEDVRRPGG